LGPTGHHFDLASALVELEIEPFRHNLAMVEEKLRAGPADEELRQTRARLLKEINTRELELYRQKADRFPADVASRLELGVRLLRAGQLDEAIEELQAIEADPQYHWRVCLYLGVCYNSRNNWPLAERHFEAALRILPVEEVAARKELLFQFAQGAARAGDLVNAVDRGMELANLDCNYRDMGLLLAAWRSQLHQADVRKT
jgi:tetratricopeptide (TPR) repeat protein